MGRSAWGCACTVAALLVALAATGARGEDQQFARQRLSLASGYGWGFGAFGSGGHDTEDVGLVPVFAGWSIGSEPFFDDSAFVSNVEIQLEGQLLFETGPRSGFGGGAAFDLRFNWLGLDPFFWFVDAGAGVAGIDFDLDQPDGFNFILQAGTGIHWRFADRWALTAKYRFHHLSNARLEEDNPGVNSHMLLVGPTFWLR